MISGNVSLYNETYGVSIYPTPIIGAVGLTENVSAHCTPGFKNIGDIVLLLGDDKVSSDTDYLAGSEYLSLIHSIVAGSPKLDLDLEIKLQKICVEFIKDGLLESAHDCSDGGIAVALSESAILGDLGFNGTFLVDGRWDVSLFGEKQSRIIISVNPSNLDKVIDICTKSDLPYCKLGTVIKDKFIVKDLINIETTDIYSSWMLELEDNI